MRKKEEKEIIENLTFSFFYFTLKMLPISDYSGLFFLTKHNIFPTKYYMRRFSTILNHKTFYYTNVVNKKRNNPFRVIYTLTSCVI